MARRWHAGRDTHALCCAADGRVAVSCSLQVALDLLAKASLEALGAARRQLVSSVLQPCQTLLKACNLLHDGLGITSKHQHVRMHTHTHTPVQHDSFKQRFRRHRKCLILLYHRLNSINHANVNATSFPKGSENLAEKNGSASEALLACKILCCVQCGNTSTLCFIKSCISALFTEC